MKFFVMLLCLFTITFTYAQNMMTDEKSNKIEVGNLAELMEAAAFAEEQLRNTPDPNDEIVGKCDEIEVQAQPSSCINKEYKRKIRKQKFLNVFKNLNKVPGVKLNHCGDHALGDEEIGEIYFCFNGTMIRDEGAGSNSLMMQFLCTDQKLPDVLPPEGLAFGPCEYGQKIITEDMQCYCNEVNADVVNGRSWYCKNNI